MTATKSPKFSPTTLHYLMHGGIRNFKIMVVMTVLNLVGFPLAMIFATFELSVDNYSSTSALFFILGIIFTAVSVLVGIVIAVNNFTYLNKKQNVDMYCSLPLTNLKRFTCDFVSGLLCYIAPIVISGIVLMITSGICFMVSPILSKGLGMTGAVFAGLIASVYFKGIVAMLMFYAFAVFVQCICGSLFESIMYTLILNALVPGTILVTIFIFLSQCYGVAMEQYLVPAISFSSPIGALIYFLMGLDNYSGEAQMLNFFTSFHLKWFIGMILITALIILASYYLYTKRKAEDVSKPFVFRGFYYIFISIISLCIGTLFIFGSEAIIPTIALMVIVYLIFEVVNKRGFKKFGYSVMRCLITLVTVFIVISIAFLTEGFGIGYKVPKASSVESVNVSYGSLNSNDYYFDSESIYTFYDEKSIQAVIDSQESAIDRYKETKDTGYFGNHSYYGIGYDYYNYDSTLRHVSIEYKLKSGRTIKREYSMTIDDLNHLVNIEVSPDYAKQVEKKIIDECSIDIDRDYMNVRSHDYINLNAMNIMGTYVGTDVRCDSYLNNRVEYNKYVKDFAACYRKDLEARTEEEILRPTTKPLAYLYGVSNVFIFEDYENTWKLLEKYGINRDDFKLKVLEGQIYKISMYEHSEFNGDWEYGYPTNYPSPNGYSFYMQNDYKTIDFENFFNFVAYSHYSGITVETDEEIKTINNLIQEVYDVSVPYAVQQQFNYKISINNESLVVPSKYNDLAQRLKVLVKDFDSRYKYNYSDYNPYDPNDMQDEFYEEN